MKNRICAAFFAILMFIGSSDILASERSLEQQQHIAQITLAFTCASVYIRQSANNYQKQEAGIMLMDHARLMADNANIDIVERTQMEVHATVVASKFDGDIPAQFQSTCDLIATMVATSLADL